MPLSRHLAGALALILLAGCTASPTPPQAPPRGPYVPAWVAQLDQHRDAILACAAAAPEGARVVNVTTLRGDATGVILVTTSTAAVMCACTGGETTLAEVGLEPEALVDLPQLLVGREPDHPTQTEVPPHGLRVGWLYWPTRAELLPTETQVGAGQPAHESFHPSTELETTP